MSTNEAAPERTWAEAGHAYNGTDAQRELLSAAIEKLDWKPAEGSLPFSQGYAIREVIQALQIPKVTQLAYNGTATFGEDACYGVYGIEGNYTNGHARAYLLDTGTAVVIVASDFWPNAAHA